jgi:hypothetical protein
VWSALTLGDDNERHAEWLRLLPRLTAGDALTIRELFRKMEAQGRHFDFEWNSFWLRWGEIGGAAALEYLANNESENFRPTASEMVLKGWAKENPGAARTWLTANSASPLYESALRGYVDGLSRNDLARATTEALTLGAGRDMSGIMEVLADQALQQRQVNGMLDWWRALPDDPNDGSARKAAIEHIYSRLQLADIDRAQSLITELAGTPYRSDERLGEVAAIIAQKDPARAVAWIASLPPSTLDEGHYIAIGRTIRAWGAQDAPATEAWINGLQPSPLRDQALVAYSEYLRRAQLPGGEQWLAQVQDPNLPATTHHLTDDHLQWSDDAIQGGNLSPTNTFIIEAPVPWPDHRGQLRN